MPSYVDRLTIPANTPSITPVMVSLPVGARVIQAVTFTFPAGCRGLVYVKAKSTYMDLTDWVRGENQSIPIMVNKVIEEPCHVDIYGYNRAIDWEHTIDIKVDYAPERVFRYDR